MKSSKESFLKYLGQTSPYPIGLEIDHAEGCFVFDPEGNKYYDLISGFSVSNTGHSNPEIVEAIKCQAEKYLHTMVYGEYIQAPQVEYARALIHSLPEGSFDQVFFTNSGAEAVEGALKLAKRYTGRHELICFRNAYHGSTHGALSVMGSELYKTAFRPLLPSVRILDFNDFTQLNQISQTTAAVIIEPIQAEAGIIPPASGFLTALRDRCDTAGTLLLFDEIQTGFGRTGELFAFMHENVIPDILLLAKALGGGMPLGAFISSRKIMSALSHDPVLGHLSTFGGHPVSCAAGLASLAIIKREQLAEKASQHEVFIRKKLQHPSILEIRGQGLMLALVLDSKERVDRFFKISLSQGLLFDYFLFCRDAIRVAPPLTISEEELSDLCTRIIETLEKT
jgi:acetylornithine/N-succinyldiaminopimelate aminotransferase